MGMSRSAVVPRSDLSQETTRVTLVPTKHLFQDVAGIAHCCRSRTPSPYLGLVFFWDGHFRKYDWGVSKG